MFSRGTIIIIMVFLVAAASGKSHFPTLLLVTFTGTKKRRPKHFMLWEKHLVEHQIRHLLSVALGWADNYQLSSHPTPSEVIP